MTQIVIRELHIYPVKGLKGIAVDQAKLTPFGLEYDRHWMVINPKNQFVTQRQFPQMAKLHTQLTETHLVMSSAESSISIPLQSHASENSLESRFSATIWKNSCDVVDEGESVSRWLTQVLQTPWPVRLVRMAKDFVREVDQSDKLSTPDPVVTTEFADGFPILIANQSSLDALNRELASELPMNRFRPNIVVAGLDAFAEHKVTAIAPDNDQYRIELQYPCERCVVTTIDQLTGKKAADLEPLKTLIRINPMPNKAAAAFGQNAKVAKGIGDLVRVGDSLVSHA
ncbi:MAG: MOSC N-terminal beta barrel domain-containing protein [Gammaproteobacteria bacterium]|nr:MOSC N-terminal beta barrel domain-containing protein [Gammaproteobacteria bacterium]NVK87189.1 MOSC N-terminal beta barrel domain-containing protein [Gammaproteobacteria bacterium]